MVEVEVKVANDEVREVDEEANDEVREVVNCIKKAVRETGAAARSERASSIIHRVPKVLREANPESYEPKLASIGPYHHEKPGLRPMEGEKLEHLQALESRNPNATLEKYAKEVKGLEEQARKCYSEDIGVGSNEFVTMMLLDGCFLVEMFLQIQSGTFWEKIWFPYLICYDILLLENQLPFFILDRIFCLAMGGEGSMKNVVLHCYGEIVRVMPLNYAASAKDSYHHLLDLVHHHCLPQKLQTGVRLNLNRDAQSGSEVGNQLTDLTCTSNPKGGQKDRDKPALFTIRSAEELQEAGIKFKRKDKMAGGSFLDIQYDRNGVVEIPYFYFSDSMHSVFQNLIAYEQCYPIAPAFFTGYASFMDSIINTAKDVQILRHTGILEHGLGSDEELASSFNQMSKGVFWNPGTTHLHEECKAINKFCATRWHTWRANLTRNYFHSPWSVLSLAAALLLLLLTITQTVFSIYPNV